MNINDHPSETTAASAGKPESSFLRLLRPAAFIAVIIGAGGSVGLMFREGQHSPRLLLVFFTIWVLSPFAILLWANLVSKRWSVTTRATTYGVTLAVALGSLAVYSRLIDLKPAGSANAFLFVIVPPVSWVFITVVISIAALISSRLSRHDTG